MINHLHVLCNDQYNLGLNSTACNHFAQVSSINIVLLAIIHVHQMIPCARIYVYKNIYSYIVSSFEQDNKK